MDTLKKIKEALVTLILGLSADERANLTEKVLLGAVIQNLTEWGKSYSDYALSVSGVVAEAIHAAKFQIAVQMRRDDQPYSEDLRICGESMTYKMYVAAGYTVRSEQRAQRVAEETADRRPRDARDQKPNFRPVERHTGKTARTKEKRRIAEAKRAAEAAWRSAEIAARKPAKADKKGRKGYKHAA